MIHGSGKSDWVGLLKRLIGARRASLVTLDRSIRVVGKLPYLGYTEVALFWVKKDGRLNRKGKILRFTTYLRFCLSVPAFQGAGPLDRLHSTAHRESDVRKRSAEQSTDSRIFD